mgnify:CR=1 FL=1
MTKLFFGAAAAAFLFAAPASAFDNTTCKDFLAGAWKMEIDETIEGKATHISVASEYSAEGTFAQTMTMTAEGAPPQTMSRNGTWDAAPGKTPDTCDATLTPEGQPAQTVTLTVVDENNVKGPEGHVSTRVTE